MAGLAKITNWSSIKPPIMNQPEIDFDLSSVKEIFDKPKNEEINNPYLQEIMASIFVKSMFDNAKGLSQYQTETPTEKRINTAITPNKILQGEKPMSFTNYIDYAKKNFSGWKYNQTRRLEDGYIDCSSLIGRTLSNNGYKINPGITTHDMPRVLPSIGFKQMTFDPNDLQVGDILWRNGHAAFYIGNGQVFGGHVHSGASVLPLYRRNGKQMFNFTHVYRPDNFPS